MSTLFPLLLENPPFSYKSFIFPTLNDDSTAHDLAQKKYPFTASSCSSMGTKLASKYPPWNEQIQIWVHTVWLGPF